MKKHLALLLVAVLSLTALLGLAPIASAADAATPSQEIAYFNVSISTNVELLFAVPADGYDVSNKETVPVQLLVWEGASSSGLYNYADKNVVKLKAAGTLPINGKQYIIFTYNGLSAAEMSTVVYARVMSTDSKGLRNYGDVYDYSIAEFANGYLNKQNPAQGGLVEAMMDYGYYAAIYYDKTSYTVDEVKNLKKVTVTAKLDGKPLFTQTTQLAPVGSELSLAAPHVDGATFTSWEGDGITDGRITLTDDVNLVANYTKKQVLSWNYDSDTVGAIKNNFNHSDSSFVKDGQKYTIKSGSEAYYTIGSTKDNQRVPHEYAGYTVVADPNNPQNNCLKLTHTGAGELKVGPGWDGTGIGDTVESVTISFDITASANGTLPATTLRIDRWGTATSGSGGSSANIANLKSNGNITFGNDTVFAKAVPNKSTNITLVLNFAGNSIDAYVDGEYVKSATGIINATTANNYLGSIDAGKNSRLRFSFFGGYLGSNLATVPAEFVEDGIFTFAETDTVVANGEINQCYKKNSNGSYTYLGEKVASAEEALAAGTTIYTATNVDYDKLVEWLDANSTCYIDNLKITYGDAMGK